VDGAAVQLMSTTTDITKSSSACGQTYFGGISSGTYDLFVTKSGFELSSSTVIVTGDTRATVTLQP
jgi:hypothetical protein